MPHGDFSDIASLVMLVGGIQHIFYPHICFNKVGPLIASFDKTSVELSALIQIMGGFMMILGCMLFTVRWNTVNGKLSGLACILCAGNIVNDVLNTIDKGVFLLRPFYAYACVLVIAGLHLMFNANPLVKVEKTK